MKDQVIIVEYEVFTHRRDSFEMSSEARKRKKDGKEQHCFASSVSAAPKVFAAPAPKVSVAPEDRDCLLSSEGGIFLFLEAMENLQIEGTHLWSY